MIISSQDWCSVQNSVALWLCVFVLILLGWITIYLALRVYSTGKFFHHWIQFSCTHPTFCMLARFHTNGFCLHCVCSWLRGKYRKWSFTIIGFSDWVSHQAKIKASQVKFDWDCISPLIAEEESGCIQYKLPCVDHTDNLSMILQGNCVPSTFDHVA